METLKLNERNLLEEKLYEDELQKCMDELEDIIESLQERRAKPGSRPGSLRRKASQYLGKGVGDKLSKSELRRLRAKAGKMKKSKSSNSLILQRCALTYFHSKSYPGID